MGRCRRLARDIAPFTTGAFVRVKSLPIYCNIEVEFDRLTI